MSPRRLVAPLLLLVSPLAPLPSAHADNVTYVGHTCGLVAGNDVTRAIQQVPYVVSGVMTVGPWTAADLVDDPSPGPSEHNVFVSTATCWVQVNNPVPAPETARPTSTVTATGTTAVRANQVSYVATPEDDVYACHSVVFQGNASPVVGPSECLKADVTGVFRNDEYEVTHTLLPTSRVSGVS